VIANAVVRDAFAADRRQRIYAKLNAAFALAPAVGPIVGTYAVQAFGWHSNFGIMVALSVTVWFAVYRWLPETNLDINRQALEPGRFLRNYSKTLVTRGFIFYAVIGGLCVGVVYSALIGAPDLIINVLHLGSTSFIIVALSILVAFVVGAGSCVLLTHRIPQSLIIAVGLALMLAASLWLLAIAWLATRPYTLELFLLPIALAFVGVGTVIPVSTAQAMAPFSRNAGDASSLLGFTRMAIAALGTLAMSLLHKGSVLDIPVVFTALSGTGVAIFAGYLMLHGMRGEPHRRGT